MNTYRDDDDRHRFLDGLGQVVQDGQMVIHAYCLMPNHYHLLATTPGGALARWMRHINGDYAAAFNKRHRRVGHLWQGRYKAIIVEEGRYLVECARYIHLNPNRAQITRPAERYRWSSYRNYVGGPVAVDWVDTELVLGELGGDRAEYRAHVEAGRGEAPISPFERAVAGLVLGSEQFVRDIAARLASDSDAGDQPALAELRRLAKSSPEEVEAAVETAFADARPARKRRVLLYAQRTHSRLRPSEIARRYGRRPSAVTMACRAISEAANRDADLASRLTAFEELLRVRNSRK